jgi:tight adherence protein C
MWSIWLYSIALLVFICLVSGIVWVSMSKPEVPDSDRTYLDPLPPLLRTIWYPIELIAIYGTSKLPQETLRNVDQDLQKNGVNYLMNAEQFIALRVVAALIFMALAALIVLSLEPANGGILWVLIAPLLGFLFPLVWLADARKRREKGVTRALPVYLDFITMSVEAGLNLTGAIRQAMEKGPKGPLRNEFGIVLRDLRSGVSRGDSLKRMGERLNMKDVNSFVNAMVQAERIGASMATTLRIQSEQRRNERFQRAEKQAMQAPVKLIFPLIVFIFPVTFIVLGFPIVMKFINS